MAENSILGIKHPERPCMKVCMMGPRAVGKTTILTAVFNETQQQIVGTQLKLIERGDTGNILLERKRELKSIFKKHGDISSVGINATSAEGLFQFSFGILGKNPSIDIDIKDFPGEYVESDPERIIQFIKDSAAVFLAVDTPHLMERDGEFNEVKNKTTIITEFFETAINSIDSEKLIIIIPLKCEKYFHEDRMPEVLSRVEDVYGKLISIFEQNPKVCCSIAPILTLGGVEFDSFDYDKDGNVNLFVDGNPNNVHYKYAGDKVYAPLFCSQPLYALLSFVAAQYSRECRDSSIWERIKKILFNVFKTDNKLFEEILKMEKYRISDNPQLGYEVVSGGELFNYNH